MREYLARSLSHSHSNTHTHTHCVVILIVAAVSLHHLHAHLMPSLNESMPGVALAHQRCVSAVRVMLMEDEF